MELVFVALPVALLIGGAALTAFIWAARSDQFEDLDTPPQRALFDSAPKATNCAQFDASWAQGRDEETHKNLYEPIDADKS